MGDGVVSLPNKLLPPDEVVKVPFGTALLKFYYLSFNRVYASSFGVDSATPIELLITLFFTILFCSLFTILSKNFLLSDGLVSYYSVLVGRIKS